MYYIKLTKKSPGTNPVIPEPAMLVWQTKTKICLGYAKQPGAEPVTLHRILYSEASYHLTVFERSTSRQVDGRAYFYKG